MKILTEMCALIAGAVGVVVCVLMGANAPGLPVRWYKDTKNMFK